MSIKVIVATLFVGAIAIGGYFAVASHRRVVTPNQTTVQPSTETQPAPPPAPAPTPSGYFYPITRYESRITNRDHGKSTTVADSRGFPCGGQFEGIHVGDDLEVSSEEVSQEVPVFAIADGSVVQASVVGGYGGLLVTKHTINDQALTIYYGHIDLGQLKVKKGEAFKAGQLLTYLGDQCSSETSNERKHLHFAIHKGSSVDVRGYVKTQAELANWLDPTEFLKSLKADEPKL